MKLIRKILAVLIKPSYEDMTMHVVFVCVLTNFILIESKEYNSTLLMALVYAEFLQV